MAIFFKYIPGLTFFDYKNKMSALEKLAFTFTENIYIYIYIKSAHKSGKKYFSNLLFETFEWILPTRKSIT